MDVLAFPGGFVAETVLIDNFTKVVDHCTLVQVEHVPTHNGGLAGEVGELDSPQDAFSLNQDVVVKKHHVLALARLDGFVHAACKATRPAKVCLLNELEALAQIGCSFLEAFLVANTLVALVGDNQSVQNRREIRRLCKGPQVLHTEIGPVERRHAHRKRS